MSAKGGKGAHQNPCQAQDKCAPAPCAPAPCAPAPCAPAPVQQCQDQAPKCCPEPVQTTCKDPCQAPAPAKSGKK